MRYRFAGQFTPGRVAVDVACGEGVGTNLMSHSGAKVCIGLDCNTPSLRRATSMYPGCNFACCEALHLCLPDNFAEVVGSCEAIEHFADPAEFVAECARVLRPGGLMICSTPNRTVYRWGGRNPYHLHEMDAEEFLAAFQGLFTEIRLYGQWQVTYPLQILKSIVPNFLRRANLRMLLRRAPGCAAGAPANAALTEEMGYPEFEVKPYAASRWVKPMYLVAVARKAPRFEE